MELTNKRESYQFNHVFEEYTLNGSVHTLNNEISELSFNVTKTGTGMSTYVNYNKNEGNANYSVSNLTNVEAVKVAEILEDVINEINTTLQ